MITRSILCIVVLICGTGSINADSVEFYVAPDGNDANSGVKDAPFATLERARDDIRELRQTAPLQEAATVWLRAGVYERTKTFELDERDSGTEAARVVYRACAGEEVRIRGGRTIAPSLAVPIADPSARERIIDPAARDKVLQIDLKALGIADYGQMRARGFRRPYIPAALEIFVNGEALRLARWPNDGVVPIGDVIDPGSIPRDGDFSNRGGIFTYGYDRPERWKLADDIWLSGLFGYGYADDTIRVASIDTTKKTITMAQPHIYGIKTGKPWHAYYALNLLEEIDLPGEYYVDRKSGVAYFYPPGPIDKADMVVSILEEPLVAMEGVSYVTFQDVTFEATRGMGVYIERGTGNLIAGCTLRNMGIVAVCIGMGIEPETLYRHEMTGKPVSRQLGSWHEHIYANSVFDRQAGRNHGVVGCDIYNTGAGGVHLGGGDRRTLVPAGNYVRNCHIHDFNRLDRSYKGAVNIDGVGNRVEHCRIHDCPNNALYLHGNDHLIEHNEVFRACRDADDMGVFYMGRDPSEQGNVIRHNFWHHNGSDHGSTCVLYFDDDACGTAVIGNVFYKNQGLPIWVNHGCDHLFDGNIFVENQGTVPAGQDTRAYDWTTDELQQKRLHTDLDITAPPYSTRYPQLLETYGTPMGKGRGSYVYRNVSVRSGAFDAGTNVLAHNVVIEGAPGFVNSDAMDFRLRDDAAVFAQTPGFRKIPFEQIGLCVDEYRKSLPSASALSGAETPAQRDARMAWWREARFGMFIHWGPASVNGTEISWSRIGHPHDHPGMETVPPEKYDALYQSFNPVKFDADAWMQLAKDAGMKYVVFITKHHDGFSMWPTEMRPEYSIAATPFKRDICKEIADAAHKRGLKLGWYYSTRDWTHPDYLVGDNRKYDEFYMAQVNELLSNYGRVDMMWFDHVAGNWRDYDFQKLFNLVYRLQPGILVNDRAARFIRETEDKPTPEIAALVRGDFDTPEQRIGKFQNDRPWESCVTMTECKDGGGWSYRPDERTRTFEECLRMLASCATGDGNLLLNIGPPPTGEIPQEQVAVLEKMGAWLAKFGDSIYGTRGGPFHNGEWGGATYKDKTVYVHVFKWKGDTLELPPLKAKIVKATALTGGDVTANQTRDALRLVLAPMQQDNTDTVIKLELDAPAGNEFQ